MAAPRMLQTVSCDNAHTLDSVPHIRSSINIEFNHIVIRKASKLTSKEDYDYVLCPFLEK